MTDGNEPAQYCELAEHVDLLSALEAAAIDHLEVDEHRAIVIYQRAILMIVVTDSLVTSAQAFDVELWNPPTHDPNRDPDDLLTSFIEELVMTTDTTHVDS